MPAAEKSHLPTTDVYEYVAGEPGQCNVIVRAHVSPEKVFGQSGSYDDDKFYQVPPNVPVFSTEDAMTKETNSNGKRSRSGGSEGLPIVAHVPIGDKSFIDPNGFVTEVRDRVTATGNKLVFVGVSVGSTMAGKEGPANGRCISIAVSGAMTIPKAQSTEPKLSQFGFGKNIRFIFGRDYGSTKLNIAMPVDATSDKVRFGQTFNPDKSANDDGTLLPAIEAAHGRAVTSITTSARDVRIHMH